MPIAIACIAAIILLIPASTVTEREFTCPVDGTVFTDMVAMSGTAFGSGLDFRRHGPITSPWLLPRCTGCGYTLHRDEDEAVTEAEKDYVLGEAYAGTWRDHSDYFCKALILEHTGGDPSEVAWSYLCATWEVAGDERYQRYAEEALRTAALMPAQAEGEDESLRNQVLATYLGVELNRRLGRFDTARQAIDACIAIELLEHERWLLRILRYQRQLIEAGDRDDHAMSDAPPLEADSEE